MSIDNITLKEIKEIGSLINGNSQEEKNAILESLIGKKVTFFCMNYIYHGEISSYSKESITIKEPKIVYETGDFKDKGFKDAQSLECPEYNIQRATIESFGILDRKND